MPRTPTTQRWEKLFREYISHMSIDSKETGITKLTEENIYGAQNLFLSEICEGLERNVRDFKCLKARQLGITTIVLPIDIFWLSVYEGTQGCLLTDDESNREKFRTILSRCINSLPKGLRVGIKTENRNGLVLNNGSTLDYVVAGKKKRKGGVAVSRAYNFLHATEVSNYGDPDAIDDFLNTLAIQHPNRLYIYESTARGFNMWYDMVRRAKDNPITQKFFFIGWWAKEVYSTDAMPQGKKIYKEYWDGSLTDEEKEKYAKVRDKYGVKLKSAQVAWHRFTASSMSETAMAQSYPWTEDEAFVATGQSFFPLKQLSSDMQFTSEAPYRAYRYHLGADFLATDIEQVTRADLADLRVWEEPHVNGVYAIGVDPAFGRSEHKDRHAIEIWRCFADAMVQVAEYATDNPETYQIAWVLAHLCGVYRNCMVNLEITGPGGAIVQELRHLRDLLDAGALSAARDGEKGVLLSIFDNVRWYLWNRPDSPGRAGYVQNWKTNSENKTLILNQLRDAYATKILRVRSMPLLEEMSKVIQDGDSIEAAGRGKDDRVFATALANKAWYDWMRPGLIANQMNYLQVTQAEMEANEESGRAKTLHGHIITDFFRQREIQRTEMEDRRMWANPYYLGNG